MRPGPDENESGPDLNALERRLSALRPSDVAIDRDRLLYEAGRAASGSVRWPWQLASAALLLLAIGLGSLLARQRTQLEWERALLARERAVRIALETQLAARAEAPPTIAAASVEAPPAPPSPSSYLALSARLARGDLDDIRTPSTDRTSPDPTQPHPEPLRARDIRRALEL